MRGAGHAGDGCSARVRKPLEGVQQRSDRAHLNLEKMPLAAALRMDAKRGSWKMSGEATAVVVVQAWLKRAVESVQEHSGSYYTLTEPQPQLCPMKTLGGLYSLQCSLI